MHVYFWARVLQRRQKWVRLCLLECGPWAKVKLMQLSGLFKAEELMKIRGNSVERS